MKKISNRRRKLAALLIILCLLANLVTGCWNQMEIEQLAFVTIVGIDRDGPNGVLVTFQCVLPRLLAKGQGGGGAPSGKPYISYTVRARNVSDAVRLLEEESSRYAAFKQLVAIVIGDDLARQGVLPRLDFFTRKAMLRRSIMVLAAKGRAADLLEKGDPGQELFPARDIRMMLERRKKLTTTYLVRLVDFLRMYERPGFEPSMTELELTPEKIQAVKKPTKEQSGKEGTAAKMVLANRGLAVFKRDKLAAFLGPAESRGVLWVQGRVDGGTITVPVATKGTWASLVITSSQSKITPSVAGDRIRFKIEIKERGYVSSLQKETLDLGRDRAIALLSQECRKAIARETRAAIQKAQELHSDFLGLGNVIYEQNPALWRQVESGWCDRWLPKAEIDLRVDCQIQNTGLDAGPAKYK